MAIKKDTLDGLLAGRDPQVVFAKDGLFDELKKALAERVLNAEIDDHLDGEAAAGKRNSRNGYSKKRVLTEVDGVVKGKLIGPREVLLNKQRAAQEARPGLWHA
jgi:putative transposase